MSRVAFAVKYKPYSLNTPIRGIANSKAIGISTTSAARSSDSSALVRISYRNPFRHADSSEAISSPRVSDSDQIIGGRKIPKGTSLMIMCAVINRHPRIWGDDADEFDPDRWDRESRGSIDPHAFAAFLVGPRMCIGRAFSMLEFKATLVEIVPKFQFEAVHVGEVKLVNPSPLLRPKDGLNVRVKYL